MAGRILFLYNAVADSDRQGYFTECMAFTQIAIMAEVLSQTAHQIVELNLQSPDQLKQFVYKEGPFMLAFCIAEGFLKKPESLADGSGAGWVRRVLAELGVPATHSDTKALDICRNKEKTHHALARFGLAVPKFQLIDPARPLPPQIKDIANRLSFPLFVKPAGGGSSVGISHRSVIQNVAELDEQIAALVGQFGKLPLLVETYLPGREYTVGIMGNEQKLVLPIIAFPVQDKVRTLDLKRSPEDRLRQEIVTVDDLRYRSLSRLCTVAFDVLDARDVLRIDIKEDNEGNPIIIDVNAIPTMTPSASLAQMAAWAGFTYEYFLEMFLRIALERTYPKA